MGRASRMDVTKCFGLAYVDRRNGFLLMPSTLLLNQIRGLPERTLMVQVNKDTDGFV